MVRTGTVWCRACGEEFGEGLAFGTAGLSKGRCPWCGSKRLARVEEVLRGDEFVIAN